MVGKVRKFMLWGYLAIAVGGILYAHALGQTLGSLVPARALQQQPLWPEVLGMSAFVLFFAGAVFFAVPLNPLFYLAAGYLFGYATGTALALTALAAGSTASYFFLGKSVSPPKALLKLKMGNLFLTLMLLRCSPWCPSSLVNAYCSMAKVRLSTFVLSTLCGAFPIVYTYTLAASKLGGPFRLSVLQTPEVATALGILSAVSLLSLIQPLKSLAGNLRASRPL